MPHAETSLHSSNPKMKLRFRILSTNKRRQRDVRNFGILLLVIGIASRDPGITPLSSIGAIMLLWSGMSWLLWKGIAKGRLQDSVWIHVLALITLILVDHQVNGILRITKSAITNFSKQILYAELSAPPEIPKPILELNHGDGIYALAFSPTDPDVIATTGDNTIKLWNQNIPETLHFKPHRDDIDALAFSPNGRYLAAGSPNAITLWDTQQKRTVQTFEGGANTLTFSPDNRYLATAKWDLNLFDMTDTGNFNQITLFAHRKHDVEIESLAFSLNGAYLLAGDDNGYIKVWDIEKRGLAVRPLKAGTGRVRDIKFLNDTTQSRFATVGTDGSIKFWRATDYQVERSISTGTVLNLDFSPDGKTLLTAAWDKVNLWDIQTGNAVFSFKQEPRAVGFGPDAFSFATGDTDGTLRIWDIPIPDTHQQLTYQNAVRIIYFLPKGISPQLNIHTKIEKVMYKVQRFYAQQMQEKGFSKITFNLETNPNGKINIHLVQGKFTADYYLEDTTTKIDEEITQYFDISENVFLVVLESAIDGIAGDTLAIAGLESTYIDGKRWHAHAGTAYIPTTKNAFKWKIIAHELGHAFGLKHDFRHPDYIMSYGSTVRSTLSSAAARWLQQHRAFQPNQPNFNNPTTIDRKNTVSTFQVEIVDADGIHQVQWFVPPTNERPPPGYVISQNEKDNLRSWKKYTDYIFKHYRKVNGENRTIIEVKHLHQKVQVRVIDSYGNITRRTFTITAPD